MHGRGTGAGVPWRGGGLTACGTTVQRVMGCGQVTSHTPSPALFQRLPARGLGAPSIPPLPVPKLTATHLHPHARARLRLRARMQACKHLPFAAPMTCAHTGLHMHALCRSAVRPRGGSPCNSNSSVQICLPASPVSHPRVSNNHQLPTNAQQRPQRTSSYEYTRLGEAFIWMTNHGYSVLLATSGGGGA